LQIVKLPHTRFEDKVRPTTSNCDDALQTVRPLQIRLEVDVAAVAINSDALQLVTGEQTTSEVAVHPCTANWICEQLPQPTQTRFEVAVAEMFSNVPVVHTERSWQITFDVGVADETWNEVTVLQGVTGEHPGPDVRDALDTWKKFVPHACRLKQSKLVSVLLN